MQAFGVTRLVGLKTRRRTSLGAAEANDGVEAAISLKITCTKAKRNPKVESVERVKTFTRVGRHPRGKRRLISRLIGRLTKETMST